MNETEKPAAVKIMFKSSSQPKGQDGFELAVSSDATEADVDRTMLLAARAREQAQDVLAGEYTGVDFDQRVEALVHELDPLEQLRRAGGNDAEVAALAASLQREAKVDGAEVGYVGYV